MKNNLFKNIQKLFKPETNDVANNSDSSTDNIYDDTSYIEDLLNSEESEKLSALMAQACKTAR